MADANRSVTQVTLLGRLHDPADAAAWSEFVDHYGRRVYVWCRKWKLQEADACDVTQDVLTRLVTRMKDFRYDPARSFRAWLRAVTHNAFNDFLAQRGRPGRGTGDDTMADLLHSVEARDDLLSHLEAEFDRELVELASAQVRLRVEPRTWEAFHLTAVEGLSGAEAAARLGMKVATVFVARSKVQKMLRAEVGKLEGTPEAVGGLR